MMSKVEQLRLELELAEAEERLADMKAAIHSPDSPKGPRPLKAEVREIRVRIRRLLEEGGVRNVADEGGVSIKPAPVTAKAKQLINGGSD